jgi:XRE family transcriptional regulator, regulator of sulfur utilization
MKTKPPKRPRAQDHAGDDHGAAELGRRVADNLRRARADKDLSLDELAKKSGVSRAGLSQIETSKSNPTLPVLWKIAVGLGVPFQDLVGEPRQDAMLLRRGDAQVLKSADGRMESRPLCPAGASPQVELYELRLLPRSKHAAEAHAPGTTEVLVVLTGTLRVSVAGDVHDLAEGDSLLFRADRPHVYENPAAVEGRYHNLIHYARG